jgi:serine/threonine protein phosphatase PrpC
MFLSLFYDIYRNFKPVRMTEDHKPSREDEQKRIRDAGGFVINNRVMGELAVSRAFGDAEFKKGIQSIIDEEGIKMPTGGKQKGNDDGDGQNNLDEPLIIAKPDVEVCLICVSFLIWNIFLFLRALHNR